MPSQPPSTRASLNAPLIVALLAVALGLPACGGEDALVANNDAIAASATTESSSPQTDPPLPPVLATAPLSPQANSHPLGAHVSDRYAPSLEGVLETKFLRVLTSRNSFDFFIHAGEVGGFQYDMVKRFTRFLNKRHRKSGGDLRIQFELIPVDHDEMIPMLLAGAGDIIAARLTVTPERAEKVRFTNSYRKVDEVIVTHADTGHHTKLEDLAGKDVFVRPSSSYHSSLLALNRRLISKGKSPVRIQPVDEALETERILELVAAEHFDYTVADSLIAEIAIEIHPNLHILEDLPVRRNGALAWATTPGATALAKEMNEFLKGHDNGSLMGNLAVQKHFGADRRLMARLRTDGKRTLSDYDALFKKYSKKHALDWRLMAALAFQESRFDPMARNRYGAIGLFQVKSATAREPYIDIPNIEGAEHVEHNIQAGIKYLKWIKKRYFDSNAEMRERDRVRMALAAYNAGPRRIILARQRAQKMGLNPNKWFRNVELALLDMHKSEPVKYVSDINQRYVAYRLLGID
jgi:membrane-bound lytic murein transglycosylase MltF